MDIEKIVKSRHSVRTYQDKIIEKEKVEILNKLINKCNKEGNLNIQLILNDPEVFDKFILHYGRLKNAQNYIAIIGKKSNYLEETCGYYGEKIVLKAQEIGLNTCWVAGTYSKNAVKAQINDDEKLVCIIAIGYGVNNGVERKSKTFNDVSLSKDVPDWYKKGIEYALLAPTAINQQRFKFKLVDENKVVLTSANNKMAKIDKGIVKYHFEIGANLKNFSWYK